MSRPSMLNTRTVNYMELIGNGKRYRVPPYQRDYSWFEEQWEDLWNDVLELRDRPDDRHYMGALVVEGTSDREFLIIDGQQRMATLSILALAVIGKLCTMADGAAEPQRNRERANELRNRFIGEKDPASLVESSRLFLNETDNGFYQDYLVQLRKPLNPRGLPKSNRLLWNCFRYFENRLDKVPELKDDGQAVARLLSETVARQLLFILITVSLRWAKTQDHFSTQTRKCCPYRHRMARMRTKRKTQTLTEQEIDKIVVAQADDDSAWGKPIRVRKAKTAAVPLPSTLAARVAFFARLHREKSMEAWLARIIQERLDLEEAAFAGVKRELAAKSSSSQQGA